MRCIQYVGERHNDGEMYTICGKTPQRRRYVFNICGTTPQRRSAHHVSLTASSQADPPRYIGPTSTDLCHHSDSWAARCPALACPSPARADMKEGKNPPPPMIDAYRAVLI
ncbi:hypothetical protein ElyMa_003527500 [Elysia marginata]|uniref:Uncharacterized protein n=1 Tax=Elysia marginata TaxID=1093978 RepID=A0AAV4EI09_9GAST|nr:hypothetical protein ElyMa_003527500 [Elysia marginata]